MPASSPVAIATLLPIHRERTSTTRPATGRRSLHYHSAAMSALFALLDAVRTRLIPALITALGVVILTAGLLSYADPATAGAIPTASPIADLETPSPVPSFSIGLPSASPSDGTGGSPGASPTATPSGRAVATRVVVPALQIDLPVVLGPSGYPYCNVAMYIADKRLGQPGQGRAIYIYAHARDGMFGPIFNLAMGPNGDTSRAHPERLKGLIVEVYTSDNKLYLYETTRVLLHQLTLDKPMAVTTEQLWLQTSEGPHGTPGKTQVIATPLSVGQADPADAHPKPLPIVCG